VKSGYVFPIVKGNELIKMENSRLGHKAICNKMLYRIGVKLGFDVRLNLNLARHSFATAHKLMGTPIAFVSESLGHSNSSVTEHYMKSLPDENRREMSNKLLSFV
jgi:integrase/recombinase XerD